MARVSLKSAQNIHKFSFMGLA